MQPNFQSRGKDVPNSEIKINWDQNSNTVDAMRNFPENKSILMHDLEMA